MTVHHARVLALAAVLIGISALGPSPSHAQQPRFDRIDPPLDDMRAKAERGDGQAQFNLGVRYDGGFWSRPQEAVRWYRLAANQGNARAQASLGLMFGKGRGVLRDYVEAHLWSNLAAAQLTGEDRDRAVKNRDDVAERMTAEQIAEAQRRAREWTPTPEP